MITFGYKNKFSIILRALSAIAIGLVMILSSEATVMVVKIIAALLLATGAVSFVYGYLHRGDGAVILMSVSSVVDIVIGFLLLFFPEWVAGAVVVIIGLVILLFGLLQFVVLAGALSSFGGRVPVILSLIAVVGGITLLFNPFSERIMSILAGVFLIFYGASELLSFCRMTMAARTCDAETDFPGGAERVEFPGGSGTDLSDVKDVEYHKIDEQ